MAAAAAAHRGQAVLNLACVVGDADSKLVRLTPPVVRDRPLWLLTHPDLRQSPRIRLVMDFVKDLVASHTEAMLGRPP